MILYHGSFSAIEKPDFYRSRDRLDFGKGFYTTPFKEQAVDWSRRFKRTKGQGVVSCYEVDEDTMCRELRILEFAGYTEEWLEFITLCRLSVGNNKQYDVIIGGVANDRVFDALEDYFSGRLDKEAAIARLRYEKPNLQYCFANQQTIDGYLKFIGSEVIA
jgi:hypothetical protein